MKQLNIVLMGSTDFAVPALNALVAAGHRICGAVCQPDRPNTRGKKVTFLPLKKQAIALGIPVYQPERIGSEEGLEILRSFKADLFVVAAYGQILSKDVLSIPPLGCINIHGSLLPEYRGAAPVQRAVLDGCTETGVTIMQMDVGMDTGDILSQQAVPITAKTTMGELYETLAVEGAQLLVRTIADLSAGSILPQPQDENRATYAQKVDKETGHICWDAPGDFILHQINGTDPAPGAFTLFKGQKMKCFKPVLLSGTFPLVAPGTVLESGVKTGLVIKTGDGALNLGEIQMPGKKRMAAADYLRGNAIPQGEILGD
jgi:methionyl-tRNA formyltransferase